MNVHTFGVLVWRDVYSTHYMAAQHAFMDQPCHTSAYTYGCSIALLSPVMVFCFFPCLLLATEEGQKKAE